MVTVMVATVKQRNPNYISKLLDRYKSNKTVAVGFPVGTESAGLSYPDGKPLLDVAVDNNFGTEVIPRRDFMGPGGALAVERSKPIAKAGVKAVNAGATSLTSVLETMGLVGATAIKQTIVDLREPANAISTITAKGSDNPLVDTGLLAGSAMHIVRDK